jgi:hypothetical protein
MDFQVKKSGSQIVVKLIPCTTNTASDIHSLCEQYKSFLTEAKENNVKLRVLFDLRHGTMDMLASPSIGPLKQFFGVEMHALSEDILSNCVIVIPMPLLAIALQKLIDAFPGTVPTQILQKHPCEKTNI